MIAKSVMFILLVLASWCLSVIPDTIREDEELMAAIKEDPIRVNQIIIVERSVMFLLGVILCVLIVIY